MNISALEEEIKYGIQHHDFRGSSGNLNTGYGSGYRPTSGSYGVDSFSSGYGSGTGKYTYSAAEKYSLGGNSVGAGYNKDNSFIRIKTPENRF